MDVPRHKNKQCSFSLGRMITLFADGYDILFKHFLVIQRKFRSDKFNFCGMGTRLIILFNRTTKQRVPCFFIEEQVVWICTYVCFFHVRHDWSRCPNKSNKVIRSLINWRIAFLASFTDCLNSHLARWSHNNYLNKSYNRHKSVLLKHLSDHIQNQIDEHYQILNGMMVYIIDS